MRHFQIGPFIYCPFRVRVYRGDNDLNLTLTEMRILLELWRAGGEVVSRGDLREAAGLAGVSNTINVHVARLRGKIGDEYVEAVHKEGYTLNLNGNA